MSSLICRGSSVSIRLTCIGQSYIKCLTYLCRKTTLDRQIFSTEKLFSCTRIVNWAILLGNHRLNVWLISVEKLHLTDNCFQLKNFFHLQEWSCKKIHKSVSVLVKKIVNIHTHIRNGQKMKLYFLETLKNLLVSVKILS